MGWTLPWSKQLLSVPTLHLEIPGGQRGKGPERFEGDETESREGGLGSQHTARTTAGLRLTTALRDGDNDPHSTKEVNEAQRG